MAKRDYYEVLGVDRGASDKEIKRAYKRLAMKYHPDRTKGDKDGEEKFKEAAEAYEILSDKQKRQAYDQYGHDAFAHGGGSQGFSGYEDIFRHFGDIFGSDFFGGGRQQYQPQKGDDLRYDVHLTLKEAVLGVKKEISYRTLVACEHCKGEGMEEGGKVEICQTCRGSGQVRYQQGMFISQATCPHCQGRGKKIEKPCKKCHGDGRMEKTETLTVTIPAGVDTGSRMRVAGKGAAGENGVPAGDLYLYMNVAEDAIFQRDGFNLHCRVDIPMTTAALGGSIEVPTITGDKVKVKIAPGTQSAKMLRIPSKGVVTQRGEGSLICHIMVETPVDLTEEQQALLKQFEESLTLETNSPKAVKFQR